MGKKQKPLEWTITPWKMGINKWIQQPVILVQGQLPFLADFPSDYMKKLQQMHDDPGLARGVFFTYIGQLKDASDQFWTKEQR